MQWAVICFGVALFVAHGSATAIAAVVSQAPPPPPPQVEKVGPAADREIARFRLENLRNELEILLANHHADEADRARQKRELLAFKVYERVPFADGLEALRRELTAQAAVAPGVQVVDLRAVARPGSARRPPAEIFSDEASFRLAADQVADTIGIRVSLTGREDAVREWVRTWPSTLVRLVDPPVGHPEFNIFPDGHGHWTADARVYRFRDTHFPRVRPRDPVTILPVGLRTGPRADPELWELVTRIQKLAPASARLYAARGEFKLEAARMQFFISRPGSRAEAGPRAVAN